VSRARPGWPGFLPTDLTYVYAFTRLNKAGFRTGDTRLSNPDGVVVAHADIDILDEWNDRDIGVALVDGAILELVAQVVVASGRLNSAVR